MNNPRRPNVEEQLDTLCDIAIDAHRDAVALADEKEQRTSHRPHVPDLVDFAPTASLRARILRRLAERAAE